MATYLISAEISILRQEGDTSDIEIIVPEIMDISSAVIMFQVKSNQGRIIFTKTREQGISVLDQTLTVSIVPDDTYNHSGVHKWELKVNISGNIYTIGRGNFEILAQVIS